jgi:hypothetical protein
MILKFDVIRKKKVNADYGWDSDIQVITIGLVENRDRYSGVKIDYTVKIIVINADEYSEFKSENSEVISQSFKTKEDALEWANSQLVFLNL